MSEAAEPEVHPDDVVPRHDCPIDGRSGFAVVDGDRQVHYLEWGPSTAPVVLCLHGGGQTAYMFEELGASLRDRYHVLAPDLPNHGDSDPLPADTPWGREALAAAVLPFLDDFGVDRAAFVGASLGGLASLRLGAAHPGRMAALALIDVGHRLEAEGVQKIVDFMRAHDSFGSLEEAGAFIAEYLPYRRSFRPESLTRNLRQRADGRWIWKHGMGRRWNRAVEEAGGVPPPAVSVMEGVDDDARRIECPSLLLRGGTSDVLSGDAAVELVAIMRDARLAIVEKAGHLAAGDNPRSTSNLISTFLDEISW
ncbi:MAG: alpha/beta hydrolase [Actinomycetota bacterium]|nr:alpha/beta hydrolase [Acidimicrobiia bacterium]MDQ3294027.1 alpha/beta hydrolase [Actinomycetota bacterium]